MFFKAGDKCLRVSPNKLNYERAQEKCETEGGQLLSVTTEQIQEDTVAFIEMKRAQFDHYKAADYFWIGGSVDAESLVWKWDNHYKSFDIYTKWQSNTPSMTKALFKFQSKFPFAGLFRRHRLWTYWLWGKSQTFDDQGQQLQLEGS